MQGQAGRVEIFIHDQAAIRPLVLDSPDGNAGKGATVITLQHQLQVWYREIHAHLATFFAMGVVHLMAFGDVAAVGVLVGPAHLKGAG
ncbi:hypothetical protein D3C84_976230 [compost metagenome]